MDYLREGIHLRGFAQIDPLVAYKNEGFTMFEDLMHSIWEEFSKLVFHAEIEFTEGPGGGNGQQPYEGGGFEAGTGRPALDYSGGTAEAQPSALEQMAAGVETGTRGAGGAVDAAAAQQVGGNGGGADVVETVVKDEHENLGRNDPCWCGSGKKYKKCHGA
jgi:preprotein translocase subunit SecA